MRLPLFHNALRVMAVVMLMLVSSRAQAQTTANGPYYATPSWDQKLQCDTAATCPRFIVLANWDGAAVLDRETGLVWEKAPSPAATWWEAAQSSCTSRTTGHRYGWRAPTIDELGSLMESGLLPALPPGHPFVLPLDASFWSSTPFPGEDSLAYLMGPSGLGSTYKTTHAPVWCVRGPGGGQ